MRRANAIDFWRGVALVMIFIDHMPGNAISYLTMRNFAIPDAADVFVFLAGWSLSYATGGPERPEPALQSILRLVSRAIELYRAQLMITMLALALLAFSAIVRGNPIYLEWHNAGHAFYDPMRAMIGSVLLTYQLGYFNILPLYVVLLLMAPVFVILSRRSMAAALVLSCAIYLFALITRVNAPIWPGDEPWFFNPLSWQLLFVLGFAAAEVSRSRHAEQLSSRLKRLDIPSWILIAVGLVLVRFQLFPDPLSVPEPRLLFIFSKTYQTPARLISFLAIVIAFRHVYDLIQPRLGPVNGFMCAMGRNSLAVFCVLSLLSLVGQIIRFIYDESLLLDICLVLLGVVLMGFTAWFVEWRSRSSVLSQSRS